MKLYPENYDLLVYLLGKSIAEGLTTDEERNVRYLIGVEYPSWIANKPIGDVIEAGLFFVGIQEMSKKIDELLKR